VSLDFTSSPVSPSYSFSMPSASSAKARAKKRPTTNALASKEAVAKKAASGKSVPQGSGNRPAGAPASSADPAPEDQAAEMMILRGEYWIQ